jgi:predicted RNA-binding protein associated with RNAse of E/G family
MLPTTATVLSDILGPVITPDTARQIVALEANEATRARLDELGDKCNEGLLTPAERKEYEAYVTAIDVISILQAKARRVLREAAL